MERPVLQCGRTTQLVEQRQPVGVRRFGCHMDGTDTLALCQHRQLLFQVSRACAVVGKAQACHLLALPIHHLCYVGASVDIYAHEQSAVARLGESVFPSCVAWFLTAVPEIPSLSTKAVTIATAHSHIIRGEKQCFTKRGTSC